MRIDIDRLTLPEPESVLLLKAEVRRLEGVITASQRLGGCTPQLDCGADRKSVASQRCRDTGGQPFDSAPITLTDDEREAVEWAVAAASDCEHPAEDTLRSLLERL